MNCMDSAPVPGTTVVVHYDHTERTNNVTVVRDSMWNSPATDSNVGENEFVTQANNRMGALRKVSIEDAWTDEDGQVHVDP